MDSVANGPTSLKSTLEVKDKRVDKQTILLPAPISNTVFFHQVWIV